jgi:hypothetical protein
VLLKRLVVHELSAELCRLQGKGTLEKMARKNSIDTCPLCSATNERSILHHPRLDHRRTEAEARLLLERSAEGTLGWDPETKKNRAALKHLSSD